MWPIELQVFLKLGNAVSSGRCRCDLLNWDWMFSWFGFNYVEELTKSISSCWTLKQTSQKTKPTPKQTSNRTHKQPQKITTKNHLTQPDRGKGEENVINWWLVISRCPNPSACFFLVFNKIMVIKYCGFCQKRVWSRILKRLNIHLLPHPPHPLLALLSSLLPSLTKII